MPHRAARRERRPWTTHCRLGLAGWTQRTWDGGVRRGPKHEVQKVAVCRLRVQNKRATDNVLTKRAMEKYYGQCTMYYGQWTHLHGVSSDALTAAQVLLCRELRSIKGCTGCTVLYPQTTQSPHYYWGLRFYTPLVQNHYVESHYVDWFSITTLVYCILKGCTVSSKGVLCPQRVYCILKGCTVSSKGVLYPQRVYCILKGCTVPVWRLGRWRQQASGCPVRIVHSGRIVSVVGV
jgi:hypothetical protein